MSWRMQIWGVIQVGECCGFAVETFFEVGADRKMRGQHLQRDDAVQPRVAALIDLSHAARAQRTENLIGTETGARFQRHAILQEW